jgi:hypothetical protein
MVNIGEVLSGIEIMKKGIPAIEALAEGLKHLAVDEKDDVKNAVIAVSKAAIDLKDGLEAIAAAVKAAVKA